MKHKLNAQASFLWGQLYFNITFDKEYGIIYYLLAKLYNSYITFICMCVSVCVCVCVCFPQVTRQ